jgi:hypothetical protein
MISMTNLELIRKKLADDYKFASDANTGDAKTTIFQLAHGNIQDETMEVYLDGEITSDYTIDRERGLLKFTPAPGEDVEVLVQYYFSAFSDEEITSFLSDNQNDIYSTLIDLVEILLADSSRRFDYSTGQTDVKPSQVFQNLKEMREIYKSKIPAERRSSLKRGQLRSSYYQREVKPRRDLSRYDEWN